MSDASGKTSGTRRRSGTIVPNCKEAPGPETTVPVTSSTSGPHVVVSPAKSPSSSSHFGMPQEPKHDTEEDLKAADAESVKVDRNTTVTTTKEKGKTLTDEKEKQAVDEAYKALMEEGFRPPSR